MPNGFFCREGCRDPDCEGCDIAKIPLDQLQATADQARTWLAQLEDELGRRDGTPFGRR